MLGIPSGVFLSFTTTEVINVAVKVLFQMLHGYIEERCVMPLNVSDEAVEYLSSHSLYHEKIWGLQTKSKINTYI